MQSNHESAAAQAEQAAGEFAQNIRLFVQFTCFKADPSWRRLSRAAREDGRESFARLVEEAAPDIKTYPYSTIGMKTDCDLLLWRKGTSPITMQDMTSQLLQTG